MFFNYFTNIKEESPSSVSSNPFEIGLTERLAVVHNCIFHDITIVVFNLKIIHGYFGRLSFVISNGAYHITIFYKEDTFLSLVKIPLIQYVSR
jgi:hypothetical protein